LFYVCFFFSSRRRHTRFSRDWSSDVCSSDLMKNAVSNGIRGVINFVRGLPGKIVSALGNLGSLLVNAGKSIINGLLNGLKSAVRSEERRVGKEWRCRWTSEQGQ